MAQVEFRNDAVIPLQVRWGTALLDDKMHYVSTRERIKC
jgi:hypothetical protein